MVMFLGIQLLGQPIFWFDVWCSNLTSGEVKIVMCEWLHEVCLLCPAQPAWWTPKTSAVTETVHGGARAAVGLWEA